MFGFGRPIDWLHTDLFMLLMPGTIESLFLIDNKSVPISFNVRFAVILIISECPLLFRSGSLTLA
jgi:hypothetical protein